MDRDNAPQATRSVGVDAEWEDDMWMCLCVAVKELGAITSSSRWCLVRGARLAHLLAQRAVAAAAAAADSRDTRSGDAACVAGHASARTVRDAERLGVLKALWAVARTDASLVAAASARCTNTCCPPSASATSLAFFRLWDWGESGGEALCVERPGSLPVVQAGQSGRPVAQRQTGRAEGGVRRGGMPGESPWQSPAWVHPCAQEVYQTFPVVPAFCEWVKWEQGGLVDPRGGGRASASGVASALKEAGAEKRWTADVGVDVCSSAKGAAARDVHAERWYAGLVWGVFVPLEFGTCVDAWLVCMWRLLVRDPVRAFPRELVALFQQAARSAARNEALSASDSACVTGTGGAASRGCSNGEAQGLGGDASRVEGEGRGQEREAETLLGELHSMCMSQGAGGVCAENLDSAMRVLPPEALVPRRLSHESTIALLHAVTINSCSYGPGFISAVSWALALAHEREGDGRTACGGGDSAAGRERQERHQQDRHQVSLSAEAVLRLWLPCVVSGPSCRVGRRIEAGRKGSQQGGSGDVASTEKDAHSRLGMDSNGRREEHAGGQVQTVGEVLQAEIADGLLQNMAAAGARAEALVLHRWVSGAVGEGVGGVEEMVGGLVDAHHQRNLIPQVTFSVFCSTHHSIAGSAP